MFVVATRVTVPKKGSSTFGGGRVQVLLSRGLGLEPQNSCLVNTQVMNTWPRARRYLRRAAPPRD